LEGFFNGQLEPNDYKLFEGRTFGLSDIKGDLQFPFSLENKKLKYVGTDQWQSIILASLVLNKIKKSSVTERQERKKENEYNYSTKL
jgi:hypothetical protein